MARNRNIEDDTKKASLNLDGLKRLRKLLSYIKPYKWHFIFALILIVIGNLVFLAIPGACGEMVNIANNEGKYGLTLNQMALGLLVLVLVQASFSFIRTILFATVSEKGMADVRQELYRKLIAQPIKFYEINRVGELTSRITADVEQLQSVLSVTIAEFLRQIVTLIGGIAILAYLTPRLSLIMLLTFPVIVISAMIFGRYIRKLSRKRQKALAETNSLVEETLHNFSVVKAFTNEQFELKKYKTNVDRIVDISLSFAKVRGLFFAFIISLLFGGIIFILWRGAVMVQAGTMEAGTLFSFVIYTGVIGGAIAGFGSLYTSLASAIGATDRVMDILVEEDELDLQTPVPELELEGRVEFQNVSFSYPTRQDMKVLDGVNISIKPGQKIALVGQSGGGKSTIAQLLLRYYDLDNGKIEIDGKDIKDFDIRGYRRNIAIVPQEVLLFGGTIFENIKYGNTEATDDQIKEAARISNALEFIDRFPEGFETIVGERGIKLSGGQRQRIAIARAVLKDPAILILDEATSSLDAESESLVQEALNKLMENRTSVIIAHRLSTIKDVDQIFVIDNGTIVEQGNHDALFERNGVYTQLAKLQYE